MVRVGQIYGDLHMDVHLVRVLWANQDSEVASVDDTIDGNRQITRKVSFRSLHKFYRLLYDPSQ